MPTMQTISQFAKSTAAQITHGKQSRTPFLTTIARLYQYPYPEQLMICVQRPDAMAVPRMACGTSAYKSH